MNSDSTPHSPRSESATSRRAAVEVNRRLARGRAPARTPYDPVTRTRSTPSRPASADADAAWATITASPSRRPSRMASRIRLRIPCLPGPVAGFVQWQIEVFLRHEPHAGGIEQAPAERAALLLASATSVASTSPFSAARVRISPSTYRKPSRPRRRPPTSSTSGPERTRLQDHVRATRRCYRRSTRRCKTVAGLSPRSAQGGLNESTALRFYKHFRDVRHPPEAARSQPESMTNFVRIAPAPGEHGASTPEVGATPSGPPGRVIVPHPRWPRKASWLLQGRKPKPQSKAGGWLLRHGPGHPTLPGMGGRDAC